MRKLGLVRAQDLHYSAGVQSVSRNEGEHETRGPLPMVRGHRFIFLQLAGDGESSDCDEADTRIIGSLDTGQVTSWSLGCRQMQVLVLVIVPKQDPLS